MIIGLSIGLSPDLGISLDLDLGLTISLDIGLSSGPDLCALTLFPQEDHLDSGLGAALIFAQNPGQI